MAQVGSLIVTGSSRFLNPIYGTCENSNKLQGYTSDTAKTANTIVRRDGNGYIYAAYYNQSSGAETPTSSSYWMYCNSDGWFRKSTLANLKSQRAVPIATDIASTGSTISVTASATTTKITYNLENPGVRSTTINGNYLRVNTGGTNADLTIPYATSAGTASTLTNFENNNSTGKNANDVTYNAHTYYTSNGPSTTLGASTNDGALYTQAYSTSWIGQIAQDYRNGNLFTRGKNNGTWKSWRKVAYSDDTYSGTLTKSQVTTALGYTPPTSDTNTTYAIGVNGTTITLTPSSGSVQSITVPYAAKATQDSDGNAINSTYLKLGGGTLTGKVTLSTAGLEVNSAAGYTIDQYGNFVHKRATDTDAWKVTNSAGTGKLTVHYETGNVTAAGSVTATQFNGPATKLTTSTAGDTNTPVYFTGGIPTACNFSVKITTFAKGNTDITFKYGMIILYRGTESLTSGTVALIGQWNSSTADLSPVYLHKLSNMTVAIYNSTNNIIRVSNTTNGYIQGILIERL